MHSPQVLLLLFVGAGIGMHLVKHGEPRDGSYNFFHASIAGAIECGLLYWGGFFS
jgi:hypothetical protein